MTPRFALPARILHWLMAALILAMLLIGAGMLSTTTARYPELLAWHRPIGLGILILALIRLAVRLMHRPPPLPADLPPLQVAAAKGSHYLLYALMIAMPLIGWAMQSAGGYPVTIWKGFVLFPILPHDIVVYGLLRAAHGLLAYAFFLLILGHIGAALFHALVRRDGVFESMAG
ncbi:cytochrome b/b6 domain-containing protein [Sphingomonas sp. BIUV-7]|uniref:Cytochrome b/b6 domain-containing protein n=1 Tax=Sphingomonas natans TaxID=3063330 RepID=A0ABT8YDI9_9SPHN|nr:cytochrome b/b6 domain-containing protein [Sphingomonas sp. BIUV-7]MDO6416389.1 cytochrome b/b6 domain-containing protein [Sphingomonas sp. BIUV-7]